MNFYISKLPKKEVINNNFLRNLFTNKGNRRGLSYEGPLAKNNMKFNSKKIKYPQTLERKFQFNFVVKAYNNLIKIKEVKNRHSNNSVEKKLNSHRLYLPIIKEFNLINDNNSNNINTNNNNIKDDEYISSTYIYKKENNNRNNSIINPFDNSENNNDELNDLYSKSKNFLEKSNSTISQSIINNKSNLSSKYISENDKDKIIFKNLSHGSIFEAYKKKYLSSIQEYKTRNKLAENTFKKQLEKIKNMKIKKSKNEELFKEYELKFNPEKFTEKLKNEYLFFQNGMVKKSSIDGDAIDRKKTSKNIENNEDNKNNLYNYEMKNNGMKPSQRIIHNILRKEQKMELYDKSLFDLNK